MSAKNFRLNKQQTWALSNLASYTEDCEVVINPESYDADERSFDFALKLKDAAPDSVWQRAERMGIDQGWLKLTMDENGDYEPMEEE